MSKTACCIEFKLLPPPGLTHEDDQKDDEDEQEANVSEFGRAQV